MDQGVILRGLGDEFTFALHEELDRVYLSSGLLALENATDPIAYPPNTTVGRAFPNSSDLLRFISQHEIFSEQKVAKLAGRLLSRALRSLVHSEFG